LFFYGLSNINGEAHPIVDLLQDAPVLLHHIIYLLCIHLARKEGTSAGSTREKIKQVFENLNYFLRATSPNSLIPIITTLVITLVSLVDSGLSVFKVRC
jgi:hypothetical protein